MARKEKIVTASLVFLVALIGWSGYWLSHYKPPFYRIYNDLNRNVVVRWLSVGSAGPFVFSSQAILAGEQSSSVQSPMCLLLEDGKGRVLSSYSVKKSLYSKDADGVRVIALSNVSEKCRFKKEEASCVATKGGSSATCP